MNDPFIISFPLPLLLAACAQAPLRNRDSEKVATKEKPASGFDIFISLGVAIKILHP